MESGEIIAPAQPGVYARILKRILRWAFRLLLGADDLTPEQARTRLDAMGSLAIRKKGVLRTKLEDAIIDAEWLNSELATADCAVILYLHGGGYTAGSIQSHWRLASDLVHSTQGRCLLINYRLAPDHPYPAALNDALSAYQWLTNIADIAPSRIVIAGDSAGGGLSIATCLRLKQLGHPLPAGLHCMSPWVDLGLTGESMQTQKTQEVVLTNPLILQNAAAYYTQDNDKRDPLISPIYADLTGLPPTLIHTGTDEILLDDSKRLLARAIECDVDCRLKIWPGMWHVWQTAAPLGMREAQIALDEAAQFMRDVVTPNNRKNLA